MTTEGEGALDVGGYPPILTTAMAAELLHVHVEYLRRMVREERVPAHRFPGGREIRFLRDELIDWVRAEPGEDRSPSAEDRTRAVTGPRVTGMAGKVAVITGGNSGIGKETAAGLAAMDVHVIIAARNPAKASATVAEIRRTARPKRTWSTSRSTSRRSRRCMRSPTRSPHASTGSTCS